MPLSSNTTSFQPRDQLHAFGKQHLHITSIRLFYCRQMNFSQENLSSWEYEGSSFHSPDYEETFLFLFLWSNGGIWFHKTMSPKIQLTHIPVQFSLGKLLESLQNNPLKRSKGFTDNKELLLVWSRLKLCPINRTLQIKHLTLFNYTHIFAPHSDFCCTWKATVKFIFFPNSFTGFVSSSVVFLTVVVVFQRFFFFYLFFLIIRAWIHINSNICHSIYFMQINYL